MITFVIIILFLLILISYSIYQMKKQQRNLPDDPNYVEPEIEESEE
jgi:preprotein translocase subunit SecG